MKNIAPNIVTLASILGILVSFSKYRTQWPFILLFGMIFVASLHKAERFVLKPDGKRFKFAPISGAYMAVSMIGFLISVLYVYKEWPDWGFAFAVVFAIMFIAAVVSMTAADPDTFVDLETKKKR